jgi:hypothetical protein
VKHLFILAAALMVILLQGCTSNDKDQPGPQLSVIKPAPVPVPPGSAGAKPISWPSDPAANGGFALPAAAPYKVAGSAPASQNVNPTPFLAASKTTGATGTNATTGSSLTSHADGTMSGPHDHPPATTGW